MLIHGLTGLGLQIILVAMHDFSEADTFVLVANVGYSAVNNEVKTLDKSLIDDIIVHFTHAKNSSVTKHGA